MVEYPAAVIYSKDGIVKWSALHDYFPLKFIPKGDNVRKDSAAFEFLQAKQCRLAATFYRLKPGLQRI